MAKNGVPIVPANIIVPFTSLVDPKCPLCKGHGWADISKQKILVCVCVRNNWESLPSNKQIKYDIKIAEGLELNYAFERG